MILTLENLHQYHLHWITFIKDVSLTHLCSTYVPLGKPFGVLVIDYMSNERKQLAPRSEFAFIIPRRGLLIRGGEAENVPSEVRGSSLLDHRSSWRITDNVYPAIADYRWWAKAYMDSIEVLGPMVRSGAPLRLPKSRS